MCLFSWFNFLPGSMMKIKESSNAKTYHLYSIDPPEEFTYPINWCNFLNTLFCFNIIPNVNNSRWKNKIINWWVLRNRNYLFISNNHNERLETSKRLFKTVIHLLSLFKRSRAAKTKERKYCSEESKMLVWYEMLQPKYKRWKYMEPSCSVSNLTE